MTDDISKMPLTDTYKTAQRLSHVETQIAGIVSTVNSVSSNVNNLSGVVGSLATELRNDMRSLMTQQNNVGKFNPALLATWIGVLITAIVVYTNFTLEPIREKLKENQSLLQKHIDESVKMAYENGKYHQKVDDLIVRNRL